MGKKYAPKQLNIGETKPEIAREHRGGHTRAQSPKRKHINNYDIRFLMARVRQALSKRKGKQPRNCTRAAWRPHRPKTLKKTHQ